MSSLRSTVSQLGLLLMIGIGVAMIWGAIAGYIVDRLVAKSRRGRVVDNITVLSDGDALITGSQFGIATVEKTSGRTLDGKPAKQGDRTAMPVAHFNHNQLEDPRLHTTMGFSLRVTEVGENRLELSGDTGLARWYAVRDGSALGHVYLVGYDLRSKLILGYIGRSGFSDERPDPEDCFSVRDLRLGATTVSRSRVGGDSTLNYVYLLDGDRLMEIDTIEHGVREVAVLPGAQALNVARRLIRRGDSFNALDRIRSETLLVIWQGDKWSTVNPQTGAIAGFALPESLRGADSSAIHLVGPNVAVVESYPKRNDFNTVRLQWISSDGEVSRDETVVLRGSGRPDERNELAAAAAVVPIPLVLGAALVLGAPRAAAYHGKSLGEALSDLAAAAGPPFLVLLVVCAALAWQVWTTHRRDGRPYAGLWAGVVMLLGPAAWLAYLAERRPAPRTKCNQCGALSPRNRPECASCGAEAFRPRMLATEVFA